MILNDYPMAVQELNASFTYFADWLYYLFWLFLLAQLCAITLLLSLQFAMEAVVMQKSYTHGFGFPSRVLAFLTFLSLFGLSSYAFLRHRLSIDPSTYWEMGLVAEKNGAYPRALYYFEKAAKAGETMPQFYLDYAEALHELGKNAQALDQAILCTEESSKKELMLGRIYYTLMRFTDAQQALEKAMSQEPNNPFVLAWLGETYVKLGKKTEAIGLFTKILETPKLPQELKMKIKNKIYDLEHPP